MYTPINRKKLKRVLKHYLGYTRKANVSMYTLGKIVLKQQGYDGFYLSDKEFVLLHADKIDELHANTLSGMK